MSTRRLVMRLGYAVMVFAWMPAAAQDQEWVTITESTGQAVDPGVWLPIDGEWLPIDGEWQAVESQVTGLTLTETEEGVQADLASDVLFDFDAASLRPKAESALSALANLIRTRDSRRVRIAGHTDAKGEDAYNQDLSERRALAVLRHLESVEKIDPSLMKAEGFGENHPVAPNTQPDGSDDPEGRQQNRRVEVVLETP